MTQLQVLLALAVFGLFLLWMIARQTAAKLRAAVVDLKKQEEAAQQSATFLQGELADQKAKRVEERTALSLRVAAAEDETRRLSKWKGVADADAKATELIRAAEATLTKARDEAGFLKFATEGQADTMLAEARQESKRLRDQARASLDSATVQAGAIVQTAEKRAEEIAGSAYDAMKNAFLYEGTVKAMKNIIEGYGDQYMVPARSLLDDLADEFGYTQAGEELKKARELSKGMVRNGTAATCEYVEEHRRGTAISFVIDAFNGKVDSILSRVRHDNVGTLGQEIRDAFTLVNFNGKAFRDARVREEYLASRLDELKWAAMAQQLKLDEREEQRRIKEQIREEEKARREFERALRDVAKEEEMLRKAMEKAREQIGHATEEQKAKYEQQLEELTEKLRQAEERGQRAISMAEQTKRGHVYIISNVGSFGEHVYKIGLTRRLEPQDRIRELGDSSVPFEFDVHALIFSEDAPALESRLHKHFVMTQVNKVNYRKEFFRTDIQHVRQEVEQLGLATKWTMTAEAREYRETLAIEKAIEANPALRDMWVRRQLEQEQVTAVVGAASEADESE